MASKAASMQEKDESLIHSLKDALKKTETAEGELLLDLSRTPRIDSAELKMLEELGAKAQHKNIKVILRGVNVDIYKVLKLGKVAPRFTFAP